LGERRPLEAGGELGRGEREEGGSRVRVEARRMIDWERKGRKQGLGQEGRDWPREGDGLWPGEGLSQARVLKAAFRGQE
jgi:hypothetical protein